MQQESNPAVFDDLPDEMIAQIFSFFPIHDIFFQFTKVSKLFHSISNLVIFHEYKKVMRNQFNQTPIEYELCISSQECRKFVKFMLRNFIYGIASKIWNPNETDSDRYRFIQQTLNPIFNNFYDLPGRSIVTFFTSLTRFLFGFESATEISREKSPNYSNNKQSILIVGDRAGSFLYNVETFKHYDYCDVPQTLQARWNTNIEKYDDKGVNSQLSKSSYFILMGNTYSGNMIDLEMKMKAIKEYSKGAEVILVTTELESKKQKRKFTIPNAQANWIAYQQFGALHRNISLDECDNTCTVSCYCFLMRYFLANGEKYSME